MYSDLTIISDMHHHGYTEDFELKGDELLWIQGQRIINANDFSITERFVIQIENSEKDDIILYGITALPFDIRGILSLHHYCLQRRSHPLIINKLAEMYTYEKSIKADIAL